MKRMTLARRLARAGALALLAAASTSCADEPLGSAPVVPKAQVVAAVTPEVAAQLLPNGQFDLRTPPAGSTPQISLSRARELALAYWRTFETEVRTRALWDRESVAKHLTLCPRAFYARSGYEPFGPDVADYFRRQFGDQWLFGLCSGEGEQQIAIAVSVLASDVVIGEDGEVYGSLPGHFRARGVPTGLSYPASPGLSVVATATQMKALVAAVPVLQRGGGGEVVFAARWVLPADGVVGVTGVGSGIDRELSQISYGAFLAGFAMQDGDPVFAATPREEPVSSSTTGETAFVVMRRADVPYRFEAVVRRTP